MGGTTEQQLEKLFSEFGNLTECRLVKGKSSAFVGFETWGAAHRALVATDGTSVLQAGKCLACSFAERSSAGKGAGAFLAKGLRNTRIFVRSLPQDVEEADLEEGFSQFGTVVSARLPRKKGSRCAFVSFSLWGEALDAVEGANAKHFPGRPGSPHISVLLAEPPLVGDTQQEGESLEPGRKRRRTGPGPVLAPAPRRNLLHGAQPVVQPAADARTEFSRLKLSYVLAMDDATVDSSRCEEIHRQLMSLRPKVHCVLPNGVSRGLPVLHPSVASGVAPPKLWSGARRSWTVGQPVGSVPDSDTTIKAPINGRARADEGVREEGRIFVSKFPVACGDAELRALIVQIEKQLPADCGVLECKVLPGKGCGFVQFSTSVAAEAAIDALKDRRVNGWDEPLHAEWARGRPHAKISPINRESPGSLKVEDRSRSRHSRSARESSVSSSASSPRRRRCSPRRQSGGKPEGTASSSGKGVDKASREDGKEEECRLFIGQFDRDVSSAQLEKIFSAYGEVVECRVLQDKGIGFVSYARDSEAKQAVQDLHLQCVPGISRGEGLNVRTARARHTPK